MAKSRNRPAYKAKKKKSNIQKQKQKQMQNQQEAEAKKQPINWAYHKDAKTVEVPINAWLMINECARQLEPIARFVAVTEQIGQQHQIDGTLLPIYEGDVEAIPGKFDQMGRPAVKLKDSFWEGKTLKSAKPLEKPTLIKADGVTVYEAPASTVPDTEDSPVKEEGITSEG